MRLDTPTCDFGWQAPDFELREPDGTLHSLADHLTPEGLVVAFICNHCPYVTAIADRLAADAKVLADEGLGFVAIMSNDYRDYPADAPDKMAEFSKQHGFHFPYLVD
ncbi:MAG: redoxin domain-containing protein, partial [Pseudomonadota bacterium]